MKITLPGQHSLQLNPVTLSFARDDKDIEKEFLADYFKKSRIHIRITLFFAIIFYAAFGFLDYVLLPDFVEPLWIIRFAVFSPFTAAIILFSFSKRYRPFFQISLSAIIVVAGVGIAAMIYIASPYASMLYYAGIILVLIFGYTFARVRFIYASISGLILVVSYEVVYILLRDIPFEVFINNNFFLLGSNFVGMFACYSMELSHRWNFYMTRILAREHEKLNDMNTQLDELNQTLRELSRTDELTQIPNRRMLEVHLSDEWARAMRDKSPIALIMFDVDYFKQFNDIYGHQMGDECLRRIAGTLVKITRRPPDLPARYGGEEFCVIFPYLTIDSAVDMAQKIRKNVEDLKIEHSGSEVSAYVTISLGVASMVPERGNAYDELIKLADSALYIAKEKGRNQVAFL